MNATKKWDWMDAFALFMGIPEKKQSISSSGLVRWIGYFLSWSTMGIACDFLDVYVVPYSLCTSDRECCYSSGYDIYDSDC